MGDGSLPGLARRVDVVSEVKTTLVDGRVEQS